MSKGQDLYKKAKKLIPGGTQLLTKRPELHLPNLWPSYYSKAEGCEVWDLDGNKYIDCSYMGVGACLLGYAFPEVNDAVKNAVDNSSVSTLNSPLEVELAETLVNMHPWADMARFAKTGGEALSVAVRIARAKTQKDKVLFCGYHGWSDWYLAANLADDSALDGHLIPGLSPAGVPRALKGTAFPFKFNDVEGLRKLAEEHKGEVAAIVTEPMRNFKPTKEFIEALRTIASDNDIVLIIDEVSFGWRLTLGGAHLTLGLEPDMAVFAKGISNGFPMAAVIGREEVMQAAQDSFISSTYWTDSIGLTAALKTIECFKKYDVQNHISEIGKMVFEGITEIAKKHKISMSVNGLYPVAHYAFDYPNPTEIKTLFTQLMLEKGFLATNAFYTSYAHKKEHVEAYLSAADQSFEIIAEAIKNNNVAALLKSDVCYTGFSRLA